jgi:hypothetical protein
MSAVDKYIELRNKYFDSDASASVEDVVSAVLLIHFGAIYTNDRSSYDTLQNSNNVLGKAIVMDNWTQLLALIGILICLIRLATHRMMKESPKLELIVSLLSWTFFLLVMVVAGGNLSKINDAITATPATTPAPSTNNAAQLDLLKLAKKQCQAELNWAILGFVITSVYTVIGAVRVFF